MYNTKLRNAGFYMLLLFAFFISAYPRISFILGGAILLIWLLDFAIFRNVDWGEYALFYPIAAFIIFTILSSVLALIYNKTSSFSQTSLLFASYFLAPGLVASTQRRKMILWAFLTGIMLVCTIHLIKWWNIFSITGVYIYDPGQPFIYFIILAFAILIAMYAESPLIREKAFLSLIWLPLLAITILSMDKTMVITLLLIIVLVGILKDRTLFIPMGVAAAIIFSGYLGIRDYVEMNLNLSDLKEFVVAPVTNINNNSLYDSDIKFFGASASSDNYSVESNESTFLVRLFRNSGPPALILLAWIIIEQGRLSFAKRKRLTLPDSKAFHLAILLILLSVIIADIYGSAFEYPSAVLASWMMLGMSEI